MEHISQIISHGQINNIFQCHNLQFLCIFSLETPFYSVFSIALGISKAANAAKHRNGFSRKKNIRNKILICI